MTQPASSSSFAWIPLLLLTASMSALGCGGDATVNAPESVKIAGEGGTVTSANGMVTLVVPAGALTQPTTISIRPAPVSADPRLVPGTEYIFEPDGLRFAKPARLTIRYDSIPMVMAEGAGHVWLHERTGSGWIATAGDPVNAGARAVSGQITGFSSFGAVISELSADLLTAALQLNSFLNDVAAETAIALLETIGAILQKQDNPAFQALAQPFLDATMTTACNAYANAVNIARSAPVDDWGVFIALLEPVYAWAAIAAKTGALGGCANAPLTVDEIQTLKFQQFVDFYLDKLEPGSIAQGFSGVVVEVERVLELRSTVQRLGLSAADARLLEEAQHPLMDELRLRAYEECGAQGMHKYLGSLRGVVHYGDYTDEELLTDLQQCGTRLTWRVTDANQSVDQNGILGGGATPGTQIVEATTRGVAEGTITLGGDVRAFRCQNGNFESDQLIVTLAGVEVHRTGATGGAFFSPPLQLDAETILSTAGIDPAVTGTHALVVSRESPGCGEYVSTTGKEPVVTLHLEYPPPFVYENDFETAAGPEWSRQTITQSPSGEKFLGTFSAEEVTLTLDNIPAHDTAKIEFDFFTIDDWEGNAPPTTGGPDIMTFLVNDQVVLRTSFSTKSGAEFQLAYPGTYPNASHPAMTGGNATGTLGYPNGSGHTGDARYRVSLSVVHSATTLRLTLRNESGEKWGTDNVRIRVVP